MTNHPNMRGGGAEQGQIGSEAEARSSLLYRAYGNVERLVNTAERDIVVPLLDTEASYLADNGAAKSDFELAA